MYSTRLIHMFLVALSVLTVTQAAWFKYGFIGKSINEVVARADVDADATTSSSVSTTSKTTSSSTSQKSSTTVQSTTTSDPPTTTTPTTTPSTPASTTSTPIVPGSTTTPPTSTTTSDSDTSTSSTDESTSTTQQPVTSVVVVTQTNSAGEVTQVTSSTVFTPSAALSNSGSDSSSTSMPTSTKNVIIGVCVGVGGAIILAVVGILIWRLRHKRNQDENEELVNYGTGTSQFNNGPEKSEASGSASGRSPFQSTLESYHAPSSNTGTNF